MNYPMKDVEKYIRLGYTHKKTKSVESNILHSGHWSCFWAIVIWVLLNVLLIFNDHPTSVLFPNLFILFGTPLIVLWSIKLCQFGLNKFIAKPSKKTIPYRSVYGTCGAIIGINTGRIFFSNTSYDISMMVFSFLVALIVYLFVFLACGSYYKVYLIRKYCPHLKK